MKIVYGSDGNYINISHLRSFTNNYNAVLGDPSPGIVKHIRIESNDLSIPIYIREDTPITIVESELPSIYAVYHVPSYMDDSIEEDLPLLLSITHSVYVTGDGRIAPLLPDTCIYVSTIPYFLMNDNSIILHMRSGHTSTMRDELYNIARMYKDIRYIFSIIPDVYSVGSIYHHIYWCRCRRTSSSLHVDVDGTYKIGYRSIDITPIISKTPKMYIGIDSYCALLGLFNQLNNLCQTIVIAHITSRDICNPSFRCTYNDLNSNIPLHHIIDVCHLNNTLKKMDIQSRIVYNKDVVEWVDVHTESDNISLSYIARPMEDIVDVIVRSNTPNLRLGATRVCTISQFESLHIYRNIKYMPIIYDVVDYCQSLIGRDYHTIHMRLEDDWIRVMSLAQKMTEEMFTNDLWTRYKEKMLPLYKKDDRVFIATHLGKSQNKNNYLLDEMKSIYPNCICRIDWRSKFDLPNGREIDALIDYLICCNGKSFIGIAGSTFSEAVDRDMRGKTSTLIYR